MRNLFKIVNQLQKVIFSYIYSLEFTFLVIKWRPLYKDSRNCSTKMLPVLSQSRRNLFRWTFTGRSFGYNNVAGRVVHNSDSILLFKERHRILITYCYSSEIL